MASRPPVLGPRICSSSLPRSRSQRVASKSSSTDNTLESGRGRIPKVPFEIGQPMIRAVCNIVLFLIRRTCIFQRRTRPTAQAPFATMLRAQAIGFRRNQRIPEDWRPLATNSPFVVGATAQSGRLSRELACWETDAHTFTRLGLGWPNIKAGTEAHRICGQVARASFSWPGHGATNPYHVRGMMEGWTTQREGLLVRFGCSSIYHKDASEVDVGASEPELICSKPVLMRGMSMGKVDGHVDGGAEMRQDEEQLGGKKLFSIGCKFAHQSRKPDTITLLHLPLGGLDGDSSPFPNVLLHTRASICATFPP